MDSFTNLIATAREQFDRNEFEKSAQSYMQALKEVETDRDRAIIWAELSINFYKMSAFDQAFDAAKNTLAYDPEYKSREEMYRIMGFSKQACGDMDTAQKFLEKSLQIDSHSDNQHFAIFELAKIYFRKQAYPEAGKLFNLVEDSFKKNNNDYWLTLLFFKGFIYYYQNDYAEGRRIFELLLENTKDNRRIASGMFGLAFISFAEKDFLKTINICESILSRDPDFFDKETLGFLTAASFYNLGRKDVFKKYYDQLMKHFPNGRYHDELQSFKKNIETGEAS
jgi:tetratricopeptide (TPR) repeat protein